MVRPSEKPHRSINSRMAARDFVNVIQWLDLAAAAVESSAALPPASIFCNWTHSAVSINGVTLAIASHKTSPTKFDACIAAFLRLATAYSGSIGFNSADNHHYPILNVWAGRSGGKEVKPHYNIDRITKNSKAGQEVAEIGDYHDRRASNLRQRMVDISVGRISKYQSERADVIRSLMRAYDYAEARGKSVHLTRAAYEHYLRLSLELADKVEAATAEAC